VDPVSSAPQGSSASLCLRDVVKTYGADADEVKALRGVSLDIVRNEYVAIMGPSGSGKSTLMNVIGCLDVPTSGTYFLEGQPVAEMSEYQLAEIRNRRIEGIAAGLPMGAVLLSPRVAKHVAQGDLGTTFGGGPMACALIEAVVDIIETEGLLANVRERSLQLRETCVVGPVVSVQGAGLLAGLRTSRPAKEVQRELLERDILTGTSADPYVVRVLAPYVIEERHIAQLRDALASLPA